MARVKDYKAKTSGIATKLATEVSPTDAVVLLPPNPRNHRLIDLRPWLGREFDDWVWAMTAVLQARLNSGLFSVATIVSFSSNGIKVFLPFLTENHVGGMPSRPSDTQTPKRVHCQELLLCLQVGDGWSYGLRLY